jgi:hypothetical protein
MVLSLTLELERAGGRWPRRALPEDHGHNPLGRETSAPVWDAAGWSNWRISSVQSVPSVVESFPCDTRNISSLEEALLLNSKESKLDWKHAVIGPPE